VAKRWSKTKGQTRDPNTLRAQYLENSWVCYLKQSLITRLSVVRQNGWLS